MGLTKKASILFGMNEPKQFLYRYNGVPENDETEDDLDGEKPVPQQGSVIVRKGKRWKVVQINVQRAVNQRGAVPVYWLFLTDQI